MLKDWKRSGKFCEGCSPKKRILFLLKDQGMTIKGVKKILANNEPLKLDEMTNHSIKATKLKNKLVKISNIIKSLKNNI